MFADRSGLSASRTPEAQAAAQKANEITAPSPPPGSMLSHALTRQWIVQRRLKLTPASVPTSTLPIP